MEKMFEAVKALMLILLTLSLFVVLDTFFALLIVNSSFFGICQRLISQRDFLKLGFCAFRVVWILVRVVFDGHFFESAFDFRFVRIPTQSHQLIVLRSRCIVLLLVPPLAKR